MPSLLEIGKSISNTNSQSKSLLDVGNEMTKRIDLGRIQDESNKFKATQERLKNYQPRADVDLGLQYKMVKAGKQDEIAGLAQERKFFDPVHAGTSDVVGGVGSAMSFLGSKTDKEGFFDKTGAKLQQYAKESSEELTDVQAMRELGDFSFKENLTNPSWWQNTVMRTVPNILSQAAAAWAGASIVKAGTTALKIPKLLSFATKTLGGGMAQSSLEATLEAGQTYTQALEKFGDKDVANKAANKVFVKNMALLTGSNTTEIALAFAKKIPFLSSAGLFAKGIKLAGSSAMEATEEMLQSKFSTEALGGDFSFTSPESKEAGAIGAIFGGAMGTGGMVLTRFQSQTTERLKGEAKAEFDKQREVEAKKGVSPMEADTKALEKVIESHPKEVEMAIKESTGVEKPSEVIAEKEVKAKPTKSPELQALEKIKEREILNNETATKEGSTEYGKRMKATGYEFSALKRAIEGKPTVKETANARKYLESNYTGKKVKTENGESGEVVGTAYGKIRVKLDDGNVKSFELNDIVKSEVSNESVLEKIKNDATDKLRARGYMFDINYDDFVKKASVSEKIKPQEARGDVEKEDTTQTMEKKIVKTETKKRISKLAKRLLDNERVNLTTEQSTYTPTSDKKGIQEAAEIAIENPEKVIAMAKRKTPDMTEPFYGHIAAAALDVVGTKDANLTSEIAAAAVKAGTRIGEETNAFKAIRHDTPGYFMMEALRAKMDHVKIDYDKLKNQFKTGKKQTREQAMNSEIETRAKKVKKKVDEKTANIQSANDIINSILC